LVLLKIIILSCISLRNLGQSNVHLKVGAPRHCDYNICQLNNIWPRSAVVLDIRTELLSGRHQWNTSTLYFLKSGLHW